MTRKLLVSYFLPQFCTLLLTSSPDPISYLLRLINCRLCKCHMYDNSSFSIINGKTSWMSQISADHHISPPKTPSFSLWPFSPGNLRKWMISSLTKKGVEMAVNRQLLCKHWESLWIGGNHTDQIYSKGKWVWNSGGKKRKEEKRKEKEGKYKLKMLVNIIMCASCNCPFKCRYWRGVLTDVDRGDTRRSAWMGTGLQLQDF